MSTIKVQSIAVPMELEVTVTPEQIVQAFDSSVQEMIDRKVKEQVAETLQTILFSPDYVRRARDWMMESVDHNYMADLIARNFGVNLIVDEILERFDGDNPMNSEQFIERMARNSMMRSLVSRFVHDIMNSQDSTVLSEIDDAVNTRTANLPNEVAERVLIVIGQRLNGGSDV